MQCAWIRFTWSVCLLAAGAGVGHAQTEPHQDFVCTSGTTKRVISVFNQSTLDGKQHAGSCRVDYTKNGETRTLYSSKASRAYCAAKAASLVTNLVNGNFSCRAQTTEQPDEAEPPEQPPANSSANP